MKPAAPRPQALRDKQGDVRNYRREGGTRLAVKVVRLLGKRHDVAAMLGDEFTSN